MENAQLEHVLLTQIDTLGKKIDALRPEWEVPSLQLSYLNTEVLSALLRLLH